MNPEAAREQAPGRSLVIQEQIDKFVNDPGLFIPDLPTDQRTQIASALFSLTIEQAWSVTFLFQNQQFGAGLALTRSVLEACCRGRWVKYHAKNRTDVMQLLAASELLAYTRCRNDEDCRALKKEHTRCKRFQAGLAKINDLLQQIG